MKITFFSSFVLLEVLAQSLISAAAVTTPAASTLCFVPSSSHGKRSNRSTISNLIQSNNFQRQKSKEVTNNDALYAFWDQSTSSTNTNIKEEEEEEKSNKKDKIPFIIDRINRATIQDREDISNLVIKVFFEEEAERFDPNEVQKKNGVTPWKAMQLAYLKNLQNGDVKGKKFVLGKARNDMFVARRVIPSRRPMSNDDDDDSNGDKVDMSKVYNSDYLQPDKSFGYTIDRSTNGVIGFVDITEKNFGLASEYDTRFNDNGDGDDAYASRTVTTSNGDGGTSTTPIRQKSASNRPLRPVLTNLAVREEARCSGVGSSLVEVCEDTVLEDWDGQYELILEVEEENKRAQAFYKKRGYLALFADPTSRRFDSSGFFLSTVRTTKICYRKDLRLQKARKAEKKLEENGGFFFANTIIQKFREVVNSNR